MPTGRWSTAARVAGGSTELRPAGRDLEGEQSPWEDRATERSQGRYGVADPKTEQSLEAVETARGQRPRRRGAAVGGEHPPGGRNRVAGNVRVILEHLRMVGLTVRETRQTPGSVAGCNKPANLRAEEAVEVVRNHEDGTGSNRWNLDDRSTTGTSCGSGRSKGSRRRGRWCIDRRVSGPCR